VKARWLDYGSVAKWLRQRIANPPSSVRLRPEPLNRRPSLSPGNIGLGGGFLLLGLARLGHSRKPHRCPRVPSRALPGLARAPGDKGIFFLRDTLAIARPPEPEGVPIDRARVREVDQVDFGDTDFPPREEGDETGKRKQTGRQRSEPEERGGNRASRRQRFVPPSHGHALRNTLWWA